MIDLNGYRAPGQQIGSLEKDRSEIEPVAARRLNPRLVFTDPDSFFGRDDLFLDLLLEQQEGQG